MGMKRLEKRLTAGAMIAMLSFGCIAGCGSKEQEAAASSEQVTVTFMNQDEVLGTATANAGEALDASSYETYENSQDADFNGWYETPTFLESSKKDLSTDSFSKDTTLYGDFRASSVAEDTRKWYIAGTSEKGILSANNWAGDITDEEKEEFELKPTGNTNEFSLTIDLYEGDQFQVIHDWSWDGQKGFGKFSNLDETQMVDDGGLGGTVDTDNVKVVMDGNYTITLSTNPENQAQDVLTVVRNSDPVTEE